jgi:hypothetical protein
MIGHGRGCLFGNIQQSIDSGLGAASDEVRRKVLWENASRLYNVVDPPEPWRVLSRGAKGWRWTS